MITAADSGKSYLRINKARIFYEIHGTGESLVLLHGGFGTNEDFEGQMPEFAKGFKVVAFERPGYERSGAANTEMYVSATAFPGDAVYAINSTSNTIDPRTPVAADNPSSPGPYTITYSPANGECTRPTRMAATLVSLP